MSVTLKGIVDPLFGTSWHKWNRYKLHDGIEFVPWHKERSLLTSPRPNGTGLVQLACLCQWDKHNLLPYACPTGTGCACSTGTSTTCANLLVAPGPSPMTNFRVVPYQKPKRS